MFHMVKYVECDKILNIWILKEILNEHVLLGNNRNELEICDVTWSDAKSIRYIYILLENINQAKYST